MAKYQGRGSKTGSKIVAKSVKEQGGRAAAAKNAVKAGAKAAVFVYNPNKIGKAAKAVKVLNPKKKTMGQISKEVASKPKGNVKVVPGDSLRRARKNRESFYATEKAKSGATARTKAAEVMRENKENRKQITGGLKPKKVVKIRSTGKK